MTNEKIAEKWANAVNDTIVYNCPETHNDLELITSGILSAITDATAELQARVEELKNTVGEQALCIFKLEAANKQLQARVEGLKRAHDDAYISGLEAYAWWKDGVQYVGTTGSTLEKATQRFFDNEAHNRHPLVDYSKPDIPPSKSGGEGYGMEPEPSDVRFDLGCDRPNRPALRRSVSSTTEQDGSQTTPEDKEK